MTIIVGYNAQPNIMDLPPSIVKFISPQEERTTNVTAPVFKQIDKNYNDWHVWKQISEGLSIKDTVPLNIKTTSNVLVKTEFYKNAVDNYFKQEIDLFFHLVAKSKDDMSSLEDVSEADKKELEAFIDSIPKFEDKGPLSYAQHYQKLCQFVKTHHKNEFLQELLFEAIVDLALVKMLLDQGVEPSPIEIEDNPCDKNSLKWVSFLTCNPEQFYNVEFCELVLNREPCPIDHQGLTYLLWTISHDALSREDDALAVIKLLTSKGARWHIDAIKDYPPIVLTNEDVTTLAFQNEDHWIKRM